MMQRRTHSGTFRNIARDIFTAVALTLVAVVIAMLVQTSQPAVGAAESVEVRFADASKSGLAIVPASCPSDAHYVGECTPPASCPNGLNFASYPSCACPTGQVQSGSICITPSCPNGLDISRYPTCQCSTDKIQKGGSCDAVACPNGLNISLYPTCLCPVGQVQSGSVCVAPPSTCPNGLNISTYPTCACPVGQVQSGTVCVIPPGTDGTGGNTCVSNAGAVCQSAANVCGMTNAGTIQCAGGCGASVPSNSLCSSTCWDGSSPSASGSCPACPDGYVASGNSCVPPGNPQFVGFPTTKGFNATGHLEVRPSLVRSGDRTTLYWGVANVRDCTVLGTNGDGASGSLTGIWDMLTSGAAGQETSPITSRTDYTLFCRSFGGATPSTITETRTVNVIPSWFEPQGSN